RPPAPATTAPAPPAEKVPAAPAEASRIWLSPPDVRPAERAALLAALDSGWVAPVGPDLDAFEAELAERCGVLHAVALSSGTAAQALGATFGGRPSGSFGAAGVLSFNGNKIITTSSGGALLCHDRGAAERARYLATQARQPAAHYEHTEVGFNYRLSNLLAAFGRGQLATLDERIERRRAIRARYREALADLPGVAFLAIDPRGTTNAWLTC